MQSFREISPFELEGNVFNMIEKDCMLVTAKKGDSINTMTASWGSLGVLWSRPVATLYVRPQRYTREFLDEAETFSLTVLEKEFRQHYGLCGSKSGRDIDKIAACGLEVAYRGETPYFTQGRVVLVCRKLFMQPMEPQYLLDASLDGDVYPDKDYHRVYIGEIQAVLVK